ncbi:zinc finger C3H1 domain-containing protein-like [Panonychus citri]|uniref:zinc finger C3H1 domain-containing protein-like n=1 Tax=Panonychus citri TaxID=50023 RepID=UPI002307E8B5|nr:zinc finger C3H1 domain-containing protein-like [Panonychus citri]
MSSLSSGMKTSFSTNSSLYSTPCQSPGSLGSLDSTRLDSLQSKESLTTPGPSENSGLLAIQLNQENFNSIGKNGSRPGSCSSGSSFNSVKTLLPPPSSCKPDQFNQTRTQDDPSKSFNFTNTICWQNLFQLRQDLTLKLSGLRQQVQSIVHQLDELEVEMCDRLNSMGQQINYDVEGKSLMNGTVNGTNWRDKKSNPKELRWKQLKKLIEVPVIQKLPAMAKGYLTRRLMTTSKVKNLIKTIKDTIILLDNYRSEDQVAQEEIDFHRRLMVQLEKSLADFHDVFFTENKSEQMKLISRTREVVIDRAWRLSTEARRLQAEKAKKFVHDKRKDSPLLSNPLRNFKQSKKDEPEEKQDQQEKEKSSDNQQIEMSNDKNSVELNEKSKQEEKQPELIATKSEEKHEQDVEMKPIEDDVTEAEPKPKSRAKAKPKAPSKPRKGAKTTKKVPLANESESPSCDSTSPSLASSDSPVPTPPLEPAPSLPPTIPEASKSAELTKEIAPKRAKRTAPASKRVTRAAKKSN